MQRGIDLERTVQGMYIEHWAEYIPNMRHLFSETGFHKSRDGKCGCSPDGLIGANGLVEIKTTNPHLYLMDIMEGSDSIPDRFYWQILGQCLVVERDWCDLAQYCEQLHSFRVIRFEPDGAQLGELYGELMKFCKELDIAEKRVREMLDAMRPPTGHERP